MIQAVLTHPGSKILDFGPGAVKQKFRVESQCAADSVRSRTISDNRSPMSSPSPTSSPRIQGWCPGALQPMLADDGWVVRVRPPMGRLTQAQASGIATLSSRYAQPTVALTSRANLQLRGVAEPDYPPLLAGLQELGLVDPDVHTESRRNLLLAPFWQKDDATTEIARTLTLALGAADAPALPGKFGFALDCGEKPMLRRSSADVRIEHCGSDFLVYADGSTTGALGRKEDVPALAMALARWFVAAGGLTASRRRMVALVARQALPAPFTTTPVPPAALPTPPLGRVPQGYLAAVEFGQLQVTTLAALATLAPLRLTPWRSLLLEGVQDLPPLSGLITNPDDARLRVSACTGAPGCGQAAAETRPVARVLATTLHAGQTLHVSGCSKGCAHPAETLTIVATAHGFNLIQRGTAASAPDWSGLSPAALSALIPNLPHATFL